MKTLLSLLVLVLAQSAFAADSTFDAATTLAPYERLPGIEEIAISPDGDKLATVHVVKDARTIVITELASGKTLTRIAAGELRLGSIFWADDRYLVILTRIRGKPFNMIMARDVDWLQGRVYDTVSHTARQFPFDGDNLGTGDNQINAVVGALGVRVIDGHDFLIFASPILVGTHFGPIITRMNLDTGEQIIVTRGDGSTTGWLLDDQGRLLALNSYNTGTESFNLMLGHGHALASVYSGKVESAPPSILGFTSTGEDILISAPRNGALLWAPLSITERKFKPTLPGNQTAQIALKERVGDRVFGGASMNDDAKYFFFDPKRAEAWDKVVQMFPDEHLLLKCWTDDFEHLVVLVDGPKDGLSDQFVDIASMHATMLGNVLEGLKQEYPTRTVHYQGGDGQDVTGFVTMPARERNTMLPLIVVAHDGPRGRDTAVFELWSQALASQGYVVLRSNFRGSSTTNSWANAGSGELGGKVLSDLAEGVADLVKQGVVDPARVCIMGSGFGGYIALASVTLGTPGSYRCAVSITGWADASTTLQYLRGELKSTERERVLMQQLGVTETDQTKLDAVSPIKHVAAMQASVLLVHGRQDDEFPVQQSEDFYDAMRSAGKHVEIVKPDSENDIMLRADSRRQAVDAVVTFLKKNNPPQ